MKAWTGLWSGLKSMDKISNRQNDICRQDSDSSVGSSLVCVDARCSNRLSKPSARDAREVCKPSEMLTIKGNKIYLQVHATH